MSTIVSLPREVLVKVLSHLGTPKGICTAALVSRTFREAADEDSLWEALAVRRFGSEVALSTVHLYDSSHKSMIKDDNRLGAFPTLTCVWKSSWRNNTVRFGQGSFYCCLILCIKWDRQANNLLLYLDVRGEHDLRRPQSSGIWLRELNTNRVVPLDHNRIQNDRPPVPDAWGMPSNIRDYEFESHSTSEQRRDRYKGVLKINANLISQPGRYEFCYANAYDSIFRDYDTCTLFTLTTEGGLIDVFDSFSLRNKSPFDADTPQSWDLRWRLHLPGIALSSAAGTIAQRNYLGPWPECIGMTGEEAVRYIQSQNPDLAVSVVRGAMYLYYCPSEVRLRVDHNGIVQHAPSRG